MLDYRHDAYVGVKKRMFNDTDPDSESNSKRRPAGPVRCDWNGDVLPAWPDAPGSPVSSLCISGQTPGNPTCKNLVDLAMARHRF